MTFEELCKLSAEDLERRKIAHEIIIQKMSWWKKPAWLAAMIPAVIAASSLGVTAYTNVSEANLRAKEYEQRITSLTDDASVTRRELRIRRLKLEEAEFKHTKAQEELVTTNLSLKVTTDERDDFERRSQTLEMEKEQLLKEQDGFYEEGKKFKAELELMTRQREEISAELNNIRKERDSVKAERDRIAQKLEEIAARDRQNLEAARAAQLAREKAKEAEAFLIAARKRAEEQAARAAAALRNRPSLTFCAGRSNCIEP